MQVREPTDLHSHAWSTYRSHRMRSKSFGEAADANRPTLPSRLTLSILRFVRAVDTDVVSVPKGTQHTGYDRANIQALPSDSRQGWWKRAVVCVAALTIGHHLRRDTRALHPFSGTFRPGAAFLTRRRFCSCVGLQRSTGSPKIENWRFFRRFHFI